MQINYAYCRFAPVNTESVALRMSEAILAILYRRHEKSME